MLTSSTTVCSLEWLAVLHPPSGGNLWQLPLRVAGRWSCFCRAWGWGSAVCSGAWLCRCLHYGRSASPLSASALLLAEKQTWIHTKLPTYSGDLLRSRKVGRYIIEVAWLQSAVSMYNTLNYLAGWPDYTADCTKLAWWQTDYTSANSILSAVFCLQQASLVQSAVWWLELDCTHIYTDRF